MDEKEKQLVIDYQTTFGSEHGMRVLENLKEHCRYNVRIDCDDAMMLQLWTGMRNVFLYIQQQIEDNPDRKRQEDTNPESEDE